MAGQLVHLTNSTFEDYGTFDLASVRLEGSELALQLNVFPKAESVDSQVWEIECVRVLDHKISLGNCESVELVADHILLWTYIYPQASVSFYGEVDDAFKIVGALYKRHRQLVAHWIPFGSFLNGDPVEMIRGRYGMFADGPLPLVRAYAEVLESYGIGVQISEPKPAAYTNNKKTGAAEVTVLILNRNCYVVAEKFNARKLRDDEV